VVDYRMLRLDARTVEHGGGSGVEEAVPEAAQPRPYWTDTPTRTGTPSVNPV